MRSWREGVLTVGAAAVPAVALWLAFSSGGYFVGPQLTAAVVCWSVVALLAVAAPKAPRLSLSTMVAAGALLALGLWTWVSAAWAPVADLARDAAVLPVLYAGAFLVVAIAISQVSSPRRRAATPAIVVLAFVVTAYGLAGRWLPSIVSLTETLSAAGRLDQPLTYWNAQGLLAGLGVVGAVSLAADAARRDTVRAAVVGAGVILVLGLWMTYSRGALLATVIGLMTLWALGKRPCVGRAVAVVGLGAALPVLATAFLDGPRTLDASAGQRTTEGALLLALTLVGGAMAVAGRRWIIDVPARPPSRTLGRGWRVGAATLVIAGVVGVVAVSDSGPGVGTPTTGASAQRLASSDSNRYAYWAVAVRSAADSPIYGQGGGSFVTTWARGRTVDERVRDAHSLPLDVLSELGVIGLFLLGAAAAGIARGASGARASEPEVACWGAIVVAWGVHACLDWTWDVPAATLPAVIAAGAITAVSRREGRASRHAGQP